MSLSTRADALLRQTVQEGGLIESVSEMTEEYQRELRHIVTVSGDTELLSAPAYYYAARKAPSVNSMISAMAIIQDELAHAHIAYRVLEELGVDRDWLMYERRPHEFRYPYALDVPLDSWVEVCVAKNGAWVVDCQVDWSSWNQSTRRVGVPDFDPESFARITGAHARSVGIAD